MDEEKRAVDSDGYDAADRPFDFVEIGGETALVCEFDPVLREKIVKELDALGYRITAAPAAKDALKAMRFHVFDLVVLNELFDTVDSQENAVLHYLEEMLMSTRRRFFVVLVSSRFRTMDNMAAFNRSVNMVVNPANSDDFGKIIKQGVVENKAFYHVLLETLQKMGKA